MKNIDVKVLDDKKVEYLRRIGLTQDAIELYDLLLRKGVLSAQEAASFSGHFPSAHYRLFYELEKQALVRRESGRPRRFVALAMDEGLKASFTETEHGLKRLIQNVTANEGGVNIILGRQGVYDAYAEYAADAKDDIMIYSIGIAFSDSLEQVQRAAIKRGVSVKHVIQQKKLSNRFVIHKWLRAGVNLRYLEKPRGFHFFVIDRTMVCVTFSDPSDTENRFSILTKNMAAVELFAANFQDIWQDAKKITI